MIRKIVQYFYPDLSKEESKRFFLLGMILFLIMGSYWLMRLIKLVIVYNFAFSEMLGWTKLEKESWQPILKTWSPIVVFILVIMYNSFIDRIKRYKLFRALCAIYACLFILLAIFLLLTTLPATRSIFYQQEPMKIMGISSFLLIESFGSLLPVMFWAWNNSNFTSTAQAKKGYPVIYALGGLGAIIGSACMFFATPTGGMWPLVCLSSLVLFTTIFAINYYHKNFKNEVAYEPADPIKISKEAPLKGKTSGFFRNMFTGGWLILRNPYLLGVFFFSTIHQIIISIVDYQLNKFAGTIFPNLQDFIYFQGFIGLGINGLTFLLSLLGAGLLFKRCSTVFTLLVFPITLTGIVSVFLVISSVELNLYFKLAIMMLLAFTMRGVMYAVNNPAKELLWLTTSQEIKLKSKGWIDSIGSRIFKSGGGAINIYYPHGVDSYRFGLVVAVIWIYSAVYIGRKNNNLVKQKQIVQ